MNRVKKLFILAIVNILMFFIGYGVCSFVLKGGHYEQAIRRLDHRGNGSVGAL
jgi:hypothetical protein